MESGSGSGSGLGFNISGCQFSQCSQHCVEVDATRNGYFCSCNSSYLLDQSNIKSCIGIVIIIMLPYSGKLWRSFKFGDLANWIKIAKLKIRQFKLNTGGPMMLSIQIAKSKSCQYQLRAVLPIKFNAHQNYTL